LAALSLDAGAAEMGLLAAAGTAPSFLLGLFAGVWVDRFRRRNLLLICDAGRAVLLATIPVAAVLGVLTMVHLYVVGFAMGVLSVMFDVSARSYLPVIVGREQLGDANGKLELSGSITAIAGPSLAGVVIKAVSAPVAIALDTCSYLASGLCTLLIRHREGPPQASRLPVLVQVREGLRIVAGDRMLRAMAGCLGLSNLASNAFFALYILLGTRDLGMDAAGLGLVYGLGASGAVIAALTAPWIARRVGGGPAILIGALIGSLEVVPVVFATPSTAVTLLMLSSFLGNFGWVLYNVHALSLRQTVTPEGMLGRVNATFAFLVTGMLPLGALAGGALGEWVGLRGTIAIAAAGSALSFLWVLLSPIPSLRRIADADQGAQGGNV
jgi:MFS family permease